jgi:acetyl esterase/lipase
MSRSLIALVLFACATAASAGTFTTYPAIEYANAGGTSLQLDLRVPDGAGPHPVIVYLHSGAWITGDRTGGPALRQATRGYAVASIDYRLAPTWTWPSQIEDCKADLLKLEEQKLPCIPLDGNASFMPPSLLMGCPIQSCRAETMAASPMSYITPDDPPFLIEHGLRDCLVSYKQSVDLDAALRAGGVPSTLLLLANGDHGGKAFDELQYVQAIDDFLDANLRGPVMPPTPPKRRAARH